MPPPNRGDLIPTMLNSCLVANLFRALVLIAGVVLLACRSSGENSFEIVRTPAARMLEATSIVRMRIGETRPLTFDQSDGGREICGYHCRAETLSILDGPLIERNFISNTPLRSGEEYVVAILDMRGKLPEIADHPEVSEDDRRFSIRRDLYHLYSLGAARLVIADGAELIDIESSDLVPKGVRDQATGGTVLLSILLESVRSIRGPRG